MGLCIKELDRIYDIREGSHNEKGNNRICQLNNFTDKTPKTEDELLKSLGLGLTRQTLHNYKKLTEMIGISVDTLNNYKKLTELVPELQDWVETIKEENS